MPGRPHRESDFIQVLMSHPTILFMSESTHLMAKKSPSRTSLIAPCGMDCAICMAFHPKEKPLRGRVFTGPEV